jgi:hypothetical protein
LQNAMSCQVYNRSSRRTPRGSVIGRSLRARIAELGGSARERLGEEPQRLTTGLRIGRRDRHLRHRLGNLCFHVRQLAQHFPPSLLASFEGGDVGVWVGEGFVGRHAQNYCVMQFQSQGARGKNGRERFAAVSTATKARAAAGRRVSADPPLRDSIAIWIPRNSRSSDNTPQARSPGPFCGKRASITIAGSQDSAKRLHTPARFRRTRARTSSAGSGRENDWPVIVSKASM